MASVRYLVNDVDQAVAFYTGHARLRARSSSLGPPWPSFARGDLTLWLAGPMASASRPMPDGESQRPAAGIVSCSTVDDLAGLVAKLLRSRAFNSATRSCQGPGGQQILCEDPSGNVIELFQPA